MMNKRRHLITAALVAAILFLPYWLYIPAVALAVVLLPLYWEAVLLGFLIDVLYGSEGSYRGALTALVLVALLIPVRDRLRWTS
jgi:hypothetical protein